MAAYSGSAPDACSACRKRSSCHSTMFLKLCGCLNMSSEQAAQVKCRSAAPCPLCLACVQRSARQWAASARMGTRSARKWAASARMGTRRTGLACRRSTSSRVRAALAPRHRPCRAATARNCSSQYCLPSSVVGNALQDRHPFPPSAAAATRGSASRQAPQTFVPAFLPSCRLTLTGSSCRYNAGMRRWALSAAALVHIPGFRSRHSNEQHKRPRARAPAAGGPDDAVRLQQLQHARLLQAGDHQFNSQPRQHRPQRPERLRRRRVQAVHQPEGATITAFSRTQEQTPAWSHPHRMQPQSSLLPCAAL